MSEQQNAKTSEQAEAKKEAKAKKSGKESKLLEQIEALQSELAEQKDTYLRLYAEYDNFRKRTAKEKADIYTNATAKAAEELLPVIDNFDRAILAQGENIDQGLKMIHTQFCEYLTRLGIAEMKAEGEKFDPARQIAVMHIEDESLEENVIVEVFQKGYTLGDKVIRPACVKVAN
ncbi:MAG: nucleotide exchange factor GrpE [Ruminococcaceae bacterium]|nr:nucleotide exchange factor GrpE [Oscillospiraceae bacterium]